VRAVDRSERNVAGSGAGLPTANAFEGAVTASLNWSSDSKRRKNMDRNPELCNSYKLLLRSCMLICEGRSSFLKARPERYQNRFLEINKLITMSGEFPGFGMEFAPSLD
jgi:hypothetical protein